MQGAAIVRIASVEDAEAIATAHVASWRAAYAGLVPQALLDGLSVRDGTTRWARRLSRVDGAHRTVVALVEAGVVGFATVGVGNEDADDAASDVGELLAIYLVPGVWGRGIGRLLHDRALDLLVDRGMTYATLWVLTANRRTRDIYERLGWVHDGAEKVVTKDDMPLPATRYRIHLVDLAGGPPGARR